MNSGGLNSGSLTQPEPGSAKGSSSSNTQSDPGIFTTTYYEPSAGTEFRLARSLRHLKTTSPQTIVPAVQANRFVLGVRSLAISQAVGAGCPFLLLGRPGSAAGDRSPGQMQRCPTWRRRRPNAGNAAKARAHGASGRLDSLGKGFLETAVLAMKWYHGPAPLRGGPAGRSAGELVNKPEGRDGLRDLPAGPGQPVQMPGMRSGVLFALHEGAPEGPLLAAGAAATGPLPLPDR